MHISRGAGLAIAGLVVAGAATATGIALTRTPRRDDSVEVPDTPAPTAPPTAGTTPLPVPSEPSPGPAPDPQSGPAPATTGEITAAVVGPTTYTVRSGDTLSAIARRFGTTVAKLTELNQIADPNRIRVGQVLKLPTSVATTPAPPTPAPTTPTTPTSPPASGQPRVPSGPAISRVPGAGKRVALTFDDGPNGAYTDSILATLKRRHVKGTFYVIGQQAARDGARLTRMRDAGHAIGNHSWDHSQLTKLSRADVQSQLKRTSDAIERTTGKRPDTFRPPYGARNAAVDEVARGLGMRDIIWDVDTVDWSRPGADAIARTAVDNARNGSIILMHDGGGNREQTVAALDRVITGLQAKGFELVTVPQLVAAGG
ncbi:MAG: polysaccharide deacetylase family protein [Thermoleophilia bacterium]|nr:polysaccharide deacetylase family protein [Thermoleophilia bacterium]